MRRRSTGISTSRSTRTEAIAEIREFDRKLDVERTLSPEQRQQAEDHIRDSAGPGADRAHAEVPDQALLRQFGECLELGG